jgi:hypothetical protein
VTPDKAGYVRKVAPVALAVASASASPADNTSPPASSTRPDRDAIVTRLATLNTATAILSAGGLPVVASEVFALAAQLEAWATR